jgi:hypothetical protein
MILTAAGIFSGTLLFPPLLFTVAPGNLLPECLCVELAFASLFEDEQQDGD